MKRQIACYASNLGCFARRRLSGTPLLASVNVPYLVQLLGEKSSLCESQFSLDRFMSSSAGEIPTGHSVIQEGKARIIFGDSNESFGCLLKTYKKSGDSKKGTVGHSEDEEEGVRVLEALSATGLRSIRYWQEIQGLKQVVANDISEDAVKAIERNVAYNEIDSKSVTSNLGDATDVMYGSRSPDRRFDVVDLDPYGGAAVFLDGAVQCVKNGGLLAVTCTDMAVLCGSYPEVVHAKYGSTGLKGAYCHEMALRTVLAAIEARANVYGRHIVPLLSVSVDFYIRMFVRVFESKAAVKHSVEKLAHVLQCVKCDSFRLQPLAKFDGRKHVANVVEGSAECQQCGSGLRMGGPVWLAPIHSEDFVNRSLHLVQESATDGESNIPTFKRLEGLLTAVSEELMDVPLYYSLPSISSKLHVSALKMRKLQAALISVGYRVSGSHACANAVKTDAPDAVLWDIMKCWAKLHPPAKKRMLPGAVCAAILAREPAIEIDFDSLQKLPKRHRAQRHPPNPEKFWGPKSRARGKRKPTTEADSLDSKRPKADTD